jgi:large subunit ribosomal protein L7/L12
MIRCTFCDHKNPPGATRCTNCGSELSGTLQAGHKSLADTLTTLIQTGQKIEAIKQYRERTGSGLKEAEDAVEALERGEPLPTPNAVLTTVDQDVVSLVREGKKIAAIKLYRDKTGVGLAEAKAAVEVLAAQFGVQSRGRGCASASLSFLVFAWFVAHIISRM